MANRRVLVVASNPNVAETIADWSSSDGYDTQVLADFASAKPALDANPPDLLVAQVKLGPFNGLHLAIRARAQHRDTPAIVIGPPDSVLEAEARQQNVRYLTEPLEEAAFAQTAREMMRRIH
jgi:DNA-binding response OmpR family regulator